MTANGARTHCKRGHPFDLFNAGYKQNGWRWCRQCAKEYNSRASKIATSKGLCGRCRKHPSVIGLSVCEGCRQWKANEAHRNLRRYTNWRQNLRLEVLRAYGGKCHCCGESNPLFLTIDHKNGDGSEEMRRNHWHQRGGYPVWALAKRQGYPNRYQVLCWNCNTGRYRNKGICPHVVKAMEASK